jgi:FLVCR family feline leukemia virus subgroup C receptor-related protein
MFLLYCSTVHNPTGLCCHVSFQDGREDAGRIGLVMMLAGMLGSVLSGIVLDMTHKFK